MPMAYSESSWNNYAIYKVLEKLKWGVKKMVYSKSSPMSYGKYQNEDDDNVKSGQWQ